MLSALARFTRPHTIIATTIQVASLFLIAGGSQVLSPTSLGPVLLTLITCLALNIYIVGLNQITDVEIDRINKPRLPLASLEMSMRQGWIVVALTGLAALVGATGCWLISTGDGLHHHVHRHNIFRTPAATEAFLVLGGYQHRSGAGRHCERRGSSAL